MDYDIIGNTASEVTINAKTLRRQGFLICGQAALRFYIINPVYPFLSGNDFDQGNFWKPVRQENQP